jgi:small-conductance mechanosensitive channel
MLLLCPVGIYPIIISLVRYYVFVWPQIICGLWLASTPLTKALNTLANRARRGANTGEIAWEQDFSFSIDKAFHVGSAILVGLYFLDVIVAVLPIRKDLPAILTAVSKPAWVAYTVALFKKWALGLNDSDRSKREDIGNSFVYNRFSDIALALAALVVSVDLLPDHFRTLGKSVLAFTGASSVVFALALREPLSQLMNGIQIATFSDKFQIGEEIQVVGTDIAGIVTSMDWFVTSVRKPDESTALIPNVRYCQCMCRGLQAIAFNYFYDCN